MHPVNDLGSTGPQRSKVLRLIAFVAIVGIAAFLFFQYRAFLSLDELAKHESALRDYQTANPRIVLGLAFLIYVVATGLSLPGALVLSLAYAWYFGFAKGVLLVSFASTAGATIAFLTSRYLLRDAIQNRFADRLKSFNAKLDAEGALYLFSLRLIPVVPFFVINLVMGLTRMRATTFWWVSQLGMLPGTMAYIYAGSSFPSLAELAETGASGLVSPRLLVAFALLGLFPIAAKRLMEWLQR